MTVTLTLAESMILDIFLAAGKQLTPSDVNRLKSPPEYGADAARLTAVIIHALVKKGCLTRVGFKHRITLDGQLALSTDKSDRAVGIEQ